MKNVNRGLAVALILGLALGGGSLLAGEGHDHGDGSSAEMEAWMKVASPGEHHENLQKTVGNWSTTNKFWMQPGAPPMETTGEARIETIMGGRFVRTVYTGDFMGQAFEGVGIDGFDNVMQKHIGLWMDNHGTMIMNFVGSCAEGGNVRTMTTEFTDPTGNRKTMKGVTTIVSDNEFKYEAYNLTDAGEFRSMEIIHTRR